jgi:hypothetical protein
MNPQQINELLRNILIAAGSSGATLLVTKGILTQEQATALVPDLVTAVITLGTGLIAYWGHKSQSAPALTAAVNSDSVPGVKVVPLSSPGPAVTVTDTGTIKPVVPGSV